MNVYMNFMECSYSEITFLQLLTMNFGKFSRFAREGTSCDKGRCFVKNVVENQIRGIQKNILLYLHIYHRTDKQIDFLKIG